MSDKKHIDRLFQEGFKDFEAAPNDAVWKNIEAKLNEKKKKRRVIPVWWRYAGVAALLALLITAGALFFNNTDANNSNQVVDTKTNTPEHLEVKDNNQPISNTVKTPVIASNEDDQNNTNSSTEVSKQESNTISNSANASNNIASSNNAPLNSNKQKSANKTNAKSLYNTTTIASSNNNNNKKSRVANTVSEEKRKANNLQNSTENSTQVANTSVANNTTTNLKKETTLVNKEKATRLIEEASQKETAVAKANDNTAVNEAEKDSKTEATPEENKRSIEEALNNTEDIANNNETPTNRWRVAPNAAPVYFNTLNEGSSIDPQFNSNSKTGEINMSYGISASYAVNKKLSVRSGINRVNLGYNTNNVVVFQSVGFSSKSSALQNVSARGNSSNADVALISSENLNANTPDSFAASNASINQALGYIEIPLEIQYTLSNKKLGVNVIGGFSSFFLNNNEIYSEEQNGTRTYLGEANNINNISYSANLGMGLNYKVTKTFDLNLEPIFKYQFNTFNNTSGNFSPFFIGVYTGFSIKF
ncbi:hypothetical protein [Algibacter pectinivorans]|uniref:Outer membrane protein beta-barrel domain-containing protein n=1 Tax=Algibacter pectinivorans TaxID=870482 RepID=A0A1I1NC45_9FLAO|nr:hypothetical protein [Algibacter pectinivorans]SFC95294.1 hypothetical protein SAMN04487987_102192 [Algibacter pectinivorans]